MPAAQPHRRAHGAGAEPLGGGEQRTAAGANTGGTDVIRSQELSPAESTAWEWKIGRGALSGNSLQPAAAPSG